MFLIAFLISLTVFPCKKALSASPLERSDKHSIFDSQWGYTSPSVNYIGFKNNDYLYVHPGHLWYKNWLFNSLEIESIGINFLPHRWDKGSYANATSITLAKVGYLFKIKRFSIYGDLRTGVFSTQQIKDNSGYTAQTTGEDTVPFMGFGTEFRLDLWRFWTRLKVSVSTTDLNVMSHIAFELGYKINDRWRLGIKSEMANRQLKLCEEDEDPSCSFDFSLNYSAIFVAFKMKRQLWIKFGVVLYSSFSIGPKDQLEIMEKDFSSVFISLE
jgi:hypothetical protein